MSSITTAARAAFDVTVLLRSLEVVATDIDRLVLGVVAPADGDDVRRSVLAYRREAALAEQVGEAQRLRLAAATLL